MTEVKEFENAITDFLREKGSQKMTLEGSDLSCWYDSKTGNPDEIHKFLEEVNNRRNDEIPDAIKKYLEMENEA